MNNIRVSRQSEVKSKHQIIDKTHTNGKIKTYVANITKPFHKQGGVVQESNTNCIRFRVS